MDPDRFMVHTTSDDHVGKPFRQVFALLSQIPLVHEKLDHNDHVSMGISITIFHLSYRHPWIFPRFIYSRWSISDHSSRNICRCMAGCVLGRDAATVFIQETL